MNMSLSMRRKLLKLTRKSKETTITDAYKSARDAARNRIKREAEKKKAPDPEPEWEWHSPDCRCVPCAAVFSSRNGGKFLATGIPYMRKPKIIECCDADPAMLWDVFFAGNSGVTKKKGGEEMAPNQKNPANSGLIFSKGGEDNAPNQEVK